MMMMEQEDDGDLNQVELTEVATAAPDYAAEEDKAWVKQAGYDDAPSLTQWLRTGITPVALQAYLVAVWLACATGFMQSLWWHFLDPTNLGLSLFGVSCLLFGMACIPAAFEVGRVLRFAVRRFWFLQGVVPGICVLLTFIPQAHLRTILMVVATGSSLLGQVGAMGAPRDSMLSRNVPVALITGILAFQGLRLAASSATVMIDYGFGGWRVFFCLLAFVASGVLAVLHQPVVVAPDAAADEDGQVDSSPKRCDTSKRTCWVWLPVGLNFGGVYSFTMSFFNNPGSIPKFVSGEPFPGSIAIILSFAAGWGLYSAVVTVNTGPDGRMQKQWLLYLVAALLQLPGMFILGAGTSLVGGVFLGLALPTMWVLAWQEAALLARQVAVGRTLFCSGCLGFFHVFCWVGVLTFSHTPVFGSIFGGRSDLWLYFVLLPCTLSTVWLGFLNYRAGREEETEGETPASRGLLFLPQTSRAGHASVLAALLLVSLPAIAYRASLCGISCSGAQPKAGRELVVVAYNNQNGYNTDGYFNGHCFVGAVKDIGADFVAIPEGEAMHFNTGNRDTVEWMSSSLPSYAVDFGPAGHNDFVGVAALSTRPFLLAKREYIPLPKPTTGDLNRYFTVNEVDVSGTAVTVVAVHLEWFGNPAIQTQALADYFSSHTGPLVISGDFNLQPNGGNTAAPNANAWAPLVAAGFQTVTPFVCTNTTADPATSGFDYMVAPPNFCPSAFTTMVVGGSWCTKVPCDAYQLDWIVYRNITLKAGTVATGLVPLTPGSATGPWCSDHGYLKATFTV